MSFIHPSRYLRDRELEASIQRDRIEAEAAELRRSRMEAEIVAEEIIIQSRREAAEQAAREASLRRSQIHAQVA
jgi:hypothetical protein